MKCAVCEKKECYEGKDCTGLADSVLDEYSDDELRGLDAAASLEAQGYMKLTRLEEVMAFARNMGYKRLGLAFCIGLEDAAGIIEGILSAEFEVYSVCCKVCGLSKDELGLSGFEGGSISSCNPVGQALILNDKKTQLNLVLGLCMGHDILFTGRSNAPVSVLAVKDRVLAHNPLGAVYSRYYRRKRFNLK
ncbi:MAG: hypothetical protein B6U97_00255 [Candidatus Altiarchaeales archaeon ex4484_96]|nr:MAG: hypothetical protein B6U97_00255 [Candidatus Altiarchaeales archaeon ex4484_96]